MKKKYLWAAVLLTWLLAAFTTAGCGRKQDNLTELLDLGQRYLTEENYEQAVVAFQKAIDVDEKCVEAYAGLADAYTGQGDAKKAAEILQKGYERTKDQILLDKKEEVMEDEGKAREDKNLDSPESGSVVGEKEPLARLQTSPELEQLLALLRNGDFNGVSWEQIEAALKGVTPPALLVLSGDPLSSTGTGAGLYVDPATELYAVYYGDYNRSERSGHGVWAFDGGYFEGSWSKDAPNGQGKIIYNSGSTEEGNLSDGRWDGEAIFDGDPVNFIDGFPVVLRKDDSVDFDGHETIYNLILYEENDYAFVCSQEQADTPWGIPGFVPEFPN